MSTLRASFELPPTLAAPRTARVILAQLLSAWAVDESVVEDAGMLVHEVVANVVDHAGSDIALEVDVVAADEWLRVGVADGSSVRPVIRELDPRASRGRGMQIVSSIARDWGAEDRDGGKRVWFDLHRAEPARD
jgi:anti-sigma regulatory factor (Ser/Thr protein kinase)